MTVKERNPVTVHKEKKIGLVYIPQLSCDMKKVDGHDSFFRILPSLLWRELVSKGKNVS